MDTILVAPRRRLIGRVMALAVAALLLFGVLATPALAETDGPVATLAAEARERRPIAATPRAQLGLVLYGVMALTVLAGGATLRRQLKGERPQTDGEFRWR